VDLRRHRLGWGLATLQAAFGQLSGLWAAEGERRAGPQGGGMDELARASASGRVRRVWSSIGGRSWDTADLTSGVCSVVVASAAVDDRLTGGRGNIEGFRARLRAG